MNANEPANFASVASPPGAETAPLARGPPDGASDIVVGIGASAGGLEATRKLMDVLPPDSGMVFILVQHLDPSHASMMVDLLAGHTKMEVLEAADGAVIQPNHVYVIPPGNYLSVQSGKLRLTVPTEPHGSRRPFDFLLKSLALDYGRRAICIILSGMGSDGSIGARAIKAAGGLIVVQDPNEAGFDGMARSAMATGVADHAVVVAEIPSLLQQFKDNPIGGHILSAKESAGAISTAPGESEIAAIIDLIRAKTPHDFTLYKTGTLQRRIERRMAMAAPRPADSSAYLKMLRQDPAELELLATDLLINVTRFFRDASVFDLIAEKIVPGILREHSNDQTVRVWVTGCSSGEEAYSLAIVFREQLAQASLDLKLQVFASDVDPDAIATAREGLYPVRIADDVSGDRLARFFVRQPDGYRVIPELRAAIVFTVQDVLVDPPFARLDLISCRNVLIYLSPQAQAKAIALFHFALRKGGILLLGTSETVGDAEDRFEVMSKSARIYRHIGPASHLDLGVSTAGADANLPALRPPRGQAPSRASVLGEVVRQLVLDAFAPASVLINRANACVFTLGAINSHLSVPSGFPTQDLYAMTAPALHPKLRLAVARANAEAARVSVAAGRFERGGDIWLLTLSAEPVVSETDQFTLISFLEAREVEQKSARPAAHDDGAKLSDLERELATARSDLADAIRNLQVSGEEQKAINEEALSVNEEYQSTNEELLASKEELQSVNEELTALNAQLQETLDRQRTTSNDLQNVLYSTDVATLFLDLNLRIRFFTPTTKSLFNVIPSDVGRPLADLHALAVDDTFVADAKAVLVTRKPREREIRSLAEAWYLRRILPYRTHTGGTEGVVVTFTDISERKRTADALETAKRMAQQADAAKSRFLAAASHDLRQPLQTLALLQGLLAQNVEGEKATRLVQRLDDTLGSMTAMLNTLLDINQIEAGTVSAEVARFPVSALLTRLRDEFTYLAEAQGLQFRVVDSSLAIVSDIRLIEQMIRNIVSNALKYTKRGKILLGVRRSAGSVRIEVCDTGIGIPASELGAIFEEYHQIGNPARQRANGLGLGLAIVRRLGDLLGHKISVRSESGKGSVFAIEIRQHAGAGQAPAAARGVFDDPAAGQPALQTGTILVIEDGADIRGLLQALLSVDGYRVETAADGIEALDLMARKALRPDVILADFNLPNGMNGLQVAAEARHLLRRTVPVIILSGDISTGTLADIAAAGCIHLAKPVKLGDMRQIVQSQMIIGRGLKPASPKVPATPVKAPAVPVVYIVDDDDSLRLGLRELLEAEGRAVADFATCEAFLAAFQPEREACLLIDATLPGMSGLELLHRLNADGHTLPAVMITGNGDVAIAVEAMKAGAADFIEKPVGASALIACVDRALALARDGQQSSEWHEAAMSRLSGLTPRQHQIMDMILVGHPNKNIAADLGISQRTVENHRAAIMKRSGATSLPDLARMAVAAQRASGQ
ncbi:MAG: chemotaxis protein CheB [Ancalomicrobiaceae bacterium]|nr:chemotaxis protein CheB [Ancalomicrobiaceae bacterium]